MPTSQHRRKRLIRKALLFAQRAGIIISGTVAILALLTFLLRLDVVTITSLGVDGNEAVRFSDVAEVTAEVLSGSYVFLPRSSTFIYPKRDLERSLKNAFPRIKDIDIEREGWRALRITIEERDPAALWCGNDPEDISRCFFVDADGFIYTEAPYFSGDVFFRYFGGSKRSGSHVGTYVAPPALLSELNEFIEHLEELDIESRGVYITSEGIKVLLVGEASLYLHHSDSFEGAVARLRTLFSGSEEDFIDDDGPRFEYIDLRFGEQVFFRWKEEDE